MHVDILCGVFWTIFSSQCVVCLKEKTTMKYLELELRGLCRGGSSWQRGSGAGSKGKSCPRTLLALKQVSLPGRKSLQSHLNYHTENRSELQGKNHNCINANNNYHSTIDLREILVMINYLSHIVMPVVSSPVSVTTWTSGSVWQRACLVPFRGWETSTRATHQPPTYTAGQPP